jgi:hypothetical protein
LISVLVCMAVAMLLVGSWLQTAAIERRQLRGQEDRLQADWLAESGLERAAARLAADESYAGETWRIAADELGGRAAGEVVIRVESLADHPRGRLVHVQADFPAGAEHRARRSKQTPVDLSPSGDSK